ncbi:MAG: alpha/beta hydrolase [Halobacteriales archaeon]
MTEEIHQDQPVETAGEPLESADAAVLMLHGRGATPGGILELAREFDAATVAYLAPRADRRTWYPNPFTAPIESNQPHLDSALATLGGLVEDVNEAGIGAKSTLLLGFSQGACLASEFAARNPRRYGGLAVLSGGLIGPAVDAGDYAGDLADTPAFVGCSDVDPHIPVERVEETTAILEGLGADVTERIYPEMGHTVNEDEVAFVGEMVETMTSG